MIQKNEEKPPGQTTIFLEFSLTKSYPIVSYVMRAAKQLQFIRTRTKAFNDAEKKKIFLFMKKNDGTLMKHCNNTK